MLEMDVHLTADGHVVVLHDATVNRTTNGTGAVAAMTLGEISLGRRLPFHSGRRRVVSLARQGASSSPRWKRCSHPLKTSPLSSN